MPSRKGKGDTLALLAFGAAGVVLFFVIVWGIFHLYRWWNWTWGYESMVESKVCEMVSEDHLSKAGKEICK
jgi:hypothetical protein